MSSTHYAPPPTSEDNIARAPDLRKHLAYRADIEGLRAVAILLVVAVHAKLPGLSGGFIGVDIFFVLSGYLITGLLVREINTTGGLDLVDFYARRLRRLLPALLLMLAVSSLAAAVLLAPFEQPAQASTAAMAALWLSNIHFAYSRLDYFGATAESNLFLHTWSLGVEEQFYLVWPALVLFLLGAWRWQGARQDVARLKGGMLGVVLLCLALSAFLTMAQPELAFYGMPSRAWQFALGALVFLHWSDHGVEAARTPRADSFPSRLRLPWISMAGWAGLGLILTAALLLDPNTPYPGLWALLPSSGAALVLAAGSAQGGAGVAQVLATRPLQALGRVSYAWYLWHWPVFLLGDTLLEQQGPLQALVFAALSLLLAVISYHLVESPIRRNRRLVAHPGGSLIIGLVLMAAAVAAALAWQRQAGEWMQRPDQQRFQQARLDAPIIYSMGCDEWYHSARVKACQFGPTQSEHTAVVMGDSVVLQWFPALAQALVRPGWRLLVITKSACPMVDVDFVYDRIGRDYIECSVWRRNALDALRTLNPDVIVLGSSQSYPFVRGQWVQGSARVLAQAQAAAKSHVFVLQATPLLPFDGPACLSRGQWRAWLGLLQDHCVAPMEPAPDTDVRTWVAEAASGLDRVTVVDLNQHVCPGGQCAARRGDAVVFRDRRHLTASYATTLGAAMAQALQWPIAQGTPPDQVQPAP